MACGVWRYIVVPGATPDRLLISPIVLRLHKAGTPSTTTTQRTSEIWTGRMAMEPPPRPSGSLFDVYLRLRPSNVANERFLNVEETAAAHPTHITIKPPTSDNRKRAVERYAFTRVFEEDARQLELFKGIGVVPLIEGVLGGTGSHGRDGLLATLGVTGSGKVRSLDVYQRGI